jgi:hypothetical protein
MTGNSAPNESTVIHAGRFAQPQRLTGVPISVRDEP